MKGDPTKDMTHRLHARNEGLFGPAWLDDLGGWDTLPHSLADPDPVIHRIAQAPASQPVPAPRAWRSAYAQVPDLSILRAPARTSARGRVPTLQNGTLAERRRRKLKVTRARILSDADCLEVVRYIGRSGPPRESKLLQFYLSVKAGLRVGEIADLELGSLLDASGNIAELIDVYATKTGSFRLVPMHPLIHDAVTALLRKYPGARYVAFSIGRGGELRHQTHTAVTNWFHRTYRELGFEGYSSHSGRRTFATKLSRTAPLPIVQEMLGHKYLSSTQLYLEPSDDVARLVRAL